MWLLFDAFCTSGKYVNNKFNLVSKPQSISSFYTVRVSAVLIDESVSKATTSSMNLPI